MEHILQAKLIKNTGITSLHRKMFQIKFVDLNVMHTEWTNYFVQRDVFLRKYI
jgi:hypothetical protein